MRSVRGQAVFLSVGYRLGSPGKLPFGLSGNLPQGFGARAGLRSVGSRSRNTLSTRVGVRRCGGKGLSHGRLWSAATFLDGFDNPRAQVAL
jgi:hypothetical protein